MNDTLILVITGSVFLIIAGVLYVRTIQPRHHD